MSPFEAMAAIVTLAAVLAYVNHRWIRQPASSALMAMSIGVSLLLIAIDRAGVLPVQPAAATLIDRVHLDVSLLHGMLGALLFAGALHIDLADLRAERLAIGLLALLATLVSTVLVGAFAYAIAGAVGLELSFGHALLFGALVSPTDPVAVLGILRKARVPKRMETQIAGESLFNDGIGVVFFTTIVAVVTSGAKPTLGDVLALFAREALGGIAFGAAAGYLVFRLLRSIDHYQTELLLTLALVVGGYSLAERIHVSAPLAAVTSGLIIGNQGRDLGMSDVTRDHLDKFWSLVDDVLNAILFVMVGLEILLVPLGGPVLLVGAILVPAVLAARWISVAVPLVALDRLVQRERGTIRILTWGGIRGAISVALALASPRGPEYGLVLSMTYFVVVFSVLVQGLTLGAVARRVAGAHLA